ncbi:hypothetical protein OIU79_021977 [Salix purpurea]|uniref:Uncharacterized protein n=1 Tax=Salix purpurea TaxID=77065 RepID=A0A9Q0WHR4_SALPP|nr:hypothetical protein OIU79_021977 [Salix purpurea]
MESGSSLLGVSIFTVMSDPVYSYLRLYAVYFFLLNFHFMILLSIFSIGFSCFRRKLFCSWLIFNKFCSIVHSIMSGS